MPSAHPTMPSAHPTMMAYPRMPDWPRCGAVPSGPWHVEILSLRGPILYGLVERVCARRRDNDDND
jgi:hypothetical protein